MRSREFIIEGRNHPVICVDVQPNYDNQYSPAHGRGASPKMVAIMEFVNKQTGPVLFFVNAEETGIADDTFDSIREYWDNTVCGWENEEDRYEEDEYGDYVEAECGDPIEWNRFEIVDKGYGYFRGLMDMGMEDKDIIKLIRAMYQAKVTDSRELFDEDYEEMLKFFDGDEDAADLASTESMSVEWTSVAQLKQFNGAYIVGGGRNECLREVELLMNAFNIKYKRIDDLVY